MMMIPFTVTVLLAMGTLFVSLLLLFMVRQIGVLSRRIPQSEPGASGPLARGEPSPVLDFLLIDGVNRARIPIGGAGPTFLLFASFSCASCRPILARLSSLPAPFMRRFLLLMPDRGVRETFANELVEVEQLGLLVAEVPDLVQSFRLQRTPFLYVVSSDGIIVEASVLASFEDLNRRLKRYEIDFKPQPEDSSHEYAVQ